MEAQQRVLHGCAKIHTFYDAKTNIHFGYLFWITFLVHTCAKVHLTRPD